MAARLVQPGVQTRKILELLKTRPMTRDELWNETKDVIKSKTHCKKILRGLAVDNRVIPFLPLGKVYNKDNFSFKLNPHLFDKNFPREHEERKLQKKIAREACKPKLQRTNETVVNELLKSESN
eukprot:TRINITY_DN9044_c0_g1_i1.p1 TRINITY_DN9044_c0_g1~~TRINITY_DN9044_c0_g1_i1.p1  ORF type:complete len:124 (-),score=9.32 TRINITY_DN9044_c0_g1_i1:28-399(-)